MNPYQGLKLLGLQLNIQLNNNVLINAG